MRGCSAKQQSALRERGSSTGALPRTRFVRSSRTHPSSQASTGCPSAQKSTASARAPGCAPGALPGFVRSDATGAGKSHGACVDGGRGAGGEVVEATGCG